MIWPVPHVLSLTACLVSKVFKLVPYVVRTMFCWEMNASLSVQKEQSPYCPYVQIAQSLALLVPWQQIIAQPAPQISITGILKQRKDTVMPAKVVKQMRPLSTATDVENANPPVSLANSILYPVFLAYQDTFTMK